MRGDIFNIKLLFGIGKVLGITPLWLKSPKILSKIYICMLTLLVISGTFLSLKKRYVALYDLNMSIEQAFLESCECLSEMFFMLSCYLGVMCRCNAWNQFFQNFMRAEERLQRLNFKDYGNICKLGIRILLINMAFFGINAYEILVWECVYDSSIEYGYILYRISMYYQLFIVYATFCLTEMLKRRYHFLNKLVEEALKEKSKIIIISLKENQRILVKLAKIQTIYTILYGAVQNLNAVFGWALFFYFTTFVMNILVNINYVLKYTQTEDVDLNINMLISYVIYSVVYTVSTVAIVMSCDGVEKNSKNIVRTCYLHQQVLERSSFKDELVLFAKFAKELEPTFTAAGFFHMNQDLLSALFSAVTTYLIIIIQFNITL